MNDDHIKRPSKERKHPVSEAGKPAGIRTGYPSNAILQHSHYTILLNLVI
jgi:hypothetical protein